MNIEKLIDILEEVKGSRGLPVEEAVGKILALEAKLIKIKAWAMRVDDERIIADNKRNTIYSIPCFILIAKKYLKGEK